MEASETLPKHLFLAAHARLLKLTFVLQTSRQQLLRVHVHKLNVGDSSSGYRLDGHEYGDQDFPMPRRLQIQRHALCVSHHLQYEDQGDHLLHQQSLKGANDFGQVSAVGRRLLNYSRDERPRRGRIDVETVLHVIQELGDHLVVPSEGEQLGCGRWLDFEQRRSIVDRKAKQQGLLSLGILVDAFQPTDRLCRHFGRRKEVMNGFVSLQSSSPWRSRATCTVGKSRSKKNTLGQKGKDKKGHPTRRSRDPSMSRIASDTAKEPTISTDIFSYSVPTL